MTRSGATTTLATAGERLTNSAAETQALGRELAAILAPGDVMALAGDLGSGKTCLIQGVCTALAVEEVVNSPTFVLLNIYAGLHHEAPLTVYHFDLYRLGSREELEDIGASQFFYETDAVSLVEWADRIPEMLPPDRWEVHLAHGDGEDERRIRWQRLTAVPETAQGREA